MNTQHPNRWEGLAAILGGLLLATGSIHNMTNTATRAGTAAGMLMTLIALPLLVFAVTALYTAQAEQSRVLARVAYTLSIIGLTFTVGPVYVQFTGVSGDTLRTLRPIFDAGVPAVIALISVVGLTLGFLLFGIATMRARVFSRWAGLILIVGAVVSFVPMPLVARIGGAVLGLGIAWLGWALWSSKREASVAAQPRPAM